MAHAPENALIVSLPAGVAAQVRQLLTLTQLEQHAVLQRQGEPAAALYFPIDAVASVVVQMESGRTVEAAMIGNEGAIGLPAFGRTPAFVATVIQVSGACLEMSLVDFQVHLADVPEFRAAVDFFIASHIASLAQTAACNRLHAVEPRAARWLLMVHDRAQRDAFSLTQEYISVMLGVQRPSVTNALGTMRDAGMIDFGYGQLTILNREALEARACECYRLVRTVELGNTS